jgi:type VI secretion system protein ImpK
VVQSSARGSDEPTVVGHRPTAIGGAGSGASRAGWGADEPTSPIMRPAAAFPGQGGATPNVQPVSTRDNGEFAPPIAAGGRNLAADLSEVQSMADPQQPEDAIAAAATPLLMLVAQLRNAVDFADVEALRRETTEQIKKFEERSIKFGARAADVSAARYILCALIDEAVMTTPWGSASQWSASSLLNQFHGETWGGEKVFSILDRVKGEPAKYLALLKLIDLVLAFGFEGKYRVLEGGRYQLDELRNEVSTLWRSFAKPVPRPLSPSWQGVSVRRGVRTYVPLWVGFACTGAILLALYGILAFQLNSALAPIVTVLQGLGQGG